MPLDNVAVSRLLELAQADSEGRVVILPTKAQEQRFLVERALKIKLLDWQVAYIWGNSGYLMPGRGTGKTLASIIRLCLSEGDPLHAYPGGKHFSFEDLNHYRQEYWYEHWRTVHDIYRRLQVYGGLKLRTIYFHFADVREESQDEVT